MRTSTELPRPFDASSASDASALRALLQREADFSHTPGLQLVIVDRNGVVFEQHQGLADIASAKAMAADTTLMAYSMSKTITAAAVLQLVDANVLRLDKPVCRYLPWEPYGTDVTVRQLLAHTAGIPNPIPLRWIHSPADDASFDERAALMVVLHRHPHLATRPGSKYAYSNIGYWLLGCVIAQVTGQSFVSYVTTNVLARLGVTPVDLGYTIADASRHASGYLEKYSLMNAFKRLLIDPAYIGDYSGRWLRIRDHFVNGPSFGGLVGTATGFSKFLSDQLREHSALFRDATRALFYEQQHTLRGEAVAMTLGWHIGSSASAPFYYKEGGGGGFHCMMRLYPAAGLGVVALCNSTGFDVRRLLDSLARRVAASTDVTGCTGS